MRKYIILVLVALMAPASVVIVPASFDGSAVASAPETRTTRREPAVSETKTRVRDAYGSLPMRFEMNQGQHDARVKFAARGAGYGLMLTGDAAVLTLRGVGKTGLAASSATPLEGDREATPTRTKATVIRTSLLNANRAPVVRGDQELPGRSNYFIGNDPRQWRTDVPNYARVVYRQVYRGIDLAYYGDSRRLEYDFNLAAGADARSIRMRIAGAKGLRVDSSGDLIIETPAGELREQTPIAYQEVNGIRREVDARYVVWSKDQVGFALGRYDRNEPLVIDPVLVYSTYLGGNADESATAVAVDGDGNAYVAGYTDSVDFPVVNPAQVANQGSFDAFVSKLNATGTALAYSTYLGGSNDEFANGVAVDSAGNAYVTGSTSSNNFPTASPIQAAQNGIFSDAFVTKLNASGSGLLYSTYLGGSRSDEGRAIAVDATGNACVTGLTRSSDFPLVNAIQNLAGGFASDAFVARLNGAGTSLIYSTYLGGQGDDVGAAIASDAAGNAYVAGWTTSTNFPTVNALQPAFQGQIVFASSNGGANWSAINNGIAPHLMVRGIAIDQVNPSTVYAATTGALYRSTNGGATWQVSYGSATTGVAIDPVNPANVYASSFLGVARSTDGGNTWVLNETISTVNVVAIQPNAPSTIWAGKNRGIYKSTDAGVTFVNASNRTNIDGETVTKLVFNSATTPTLYAGTSSATFGSIYKTSDGGITWQGSFLSAGRVSIGALAADPATPTTLYTAAGSFGGVFKTTDGGTIWRFTPLNPEPSDVFALAVDPSNAATVYAGTTRGMYKSTDSGDTWAPINKGLSNTTISALATDRNTSGRVLAGTFSAADAFVTKLNPIGSAIAFSTYLGGGDADGAKGIALDGLGNMYLTGSTNSSDFPSVGAPEPTHPGNDSEAFVAKLAAAGDHLIYSTYLGGSGDDAGAAIAVDGLGNAYVTGTTSSTDFPRAASLQATLGGSSDAFVVKYSATGVPIYSTYLGGSDAESGLGIGVDSTGRAVVAGQTLSSNLVATTGALQTSLRGSDDAFVAMISDAPAAVADLSITLTAPEAAVSGTDITYRINVLNKGPNTAQSVTIADPLPFFLGFKSCSSNMGTCAGDNGNRVIRVDSLAVNAVAAITIVATVGCGAPNGTVLTNTVTGSAASTDPNSSNSSSTALTTVSNPAPAITCPANINVSTAHPTDTGIEIDYPAPAVTDNCANPYAVCAPDPGSRFPVGTTTVICTAHDIGGATATCQFSVMVTAGSEIADLGITQAASPNPVTTGGNVTCTLTIANAGPSTAHNVVISDILPVALSLQSVEISAPDAQSSVVGNGVTVSVPSMGSGGTVTVRLTAKAACTSAANSIAVNSATVTSLVTDQKLSDNQATTLILLANPPPSVTCPGDLTVPATSTGSTVVNYSLPAVTDNCPGAAFVCVPAAGANFPVGTTTVTCTATDAGGATAQCSFRVTVITIPDNQPFVERASLTGKQLTVVGRNFGDGAKVFVDGAKQKTTNDAANPRTTLFAPKAGKWIAPGQAVTLRVKNPDGTLSNEFPFTRPR